VSPPRVLLIDNYDSFTYNLYQYLCELGASVSVVRNDAITVEQVQAQPPDFLVISPGPGVPRDAGISVDLVRALAPTTPILGVCLGHQAITEAFGGVVTRAPELMHGKASDVFHDGAGVFQELPNPFSAIRYHSLCAAPEAVPDTLEVTARTGSGVIMAVRHREFPVYGVQFHPESILTQHGKELLRNFLQSLAREAEVPRRPSASTDASPRGEVPPDPDWRLTTGGAAMNIRDALGKLVDGEDLSREQAQAAMRSLVEGQATPSQIAAFAVALRMKGETPEEIAGLAEVMREAATRVSAGNDVVDVVGTGGDGAGTFNISTLSALVVASAGGRVAKHGNRSVTSACGAADFLEAIGVAIDLSPDGVARCIAETGFGFMFAPQYHPAMRHAVVPRREIGVRTVFNILGPLTNPAGARRQLTGVALPGLGKTMARVLALLGAEHAVVVHGLDGLDEISVCAPTQIHEARDGRVWSYVIEPEQFGLQRRTTDAVRGGTVEANVRMAAAVLDGEPGPSRDVVLLNAGAALYMADLVDSIQAGIEHAADELDSGRAKSKVAQVAAVSRRIKAETSTAAEVA